MNTKTALTDAFITAMSKFADQDEWRVEINERDAQALAAEAERIALEHGVDVDIRRAPSALIIRVK